MQLANVLWHGDSRLCTYGSHRLTKEVDAIILEIYSFFAL